MKTDRKIAVIDVLQCCRLMKPACLRINEASLPWKQSGMPYFRVLRPCASEAETLKVRLVRDHKTRTLNSPSFMADFLLASSTRLSRYCRRGIYNDHHSDHQIITTNALRRAVVLTYTETKNTKQYSHAGLALLNHVFN